MTIWDKCISCERCDEDPYQGIGLRCLIESSFWDDDKICPYWKSDGKEVSSMKEELKK